MEEIFHLGVKGLVRNKLGKILLLQVNTNKLIDENRAYWDIPGGRLRKGDTVEATLRREIEEETGVTKISGVKPMTLVMSNLRIPQKTGGDVGLILYIWICDAPEVEAIRLSQEHIAYQWFEPKTAADLLKTKYPSVFTDQLKSL